MREGPSTVDADRRVTALECTDAIHHWRGIGGRVEPQAGEAPVEDIMHLRWTDQHAMGTQKHEDQHSWYMH